MLAAVLRDFNQLGLEDLPRPEPGPGEVLVRIESCGFCATDYKAIKGIRRNVAFPLIPSHEPAGIIAAVGPFVTNVKEGDEVLISPSGYCGLCRNCRLGLTHYCERAYTTGGDGVRGQDAHRSGAGPLSLTRSHGRVFESLAEDQAGAAAVWRARLAKGPLRGVVGLPHLQYPAMVPPPLESSPAASPSLREKGSRRG